MTTGFLGTPHILHVLSQNGRGDLAYDLLLQEKAPSWLYSVNHGATTMWEHWNSLKEDGTFSLIPSTRGAYYPYGHYTYSEETGLIVCISDDLKEKYVFKKDTNTLTFVKKDSAALPEYSYNGKVRPCIPDGAIFTDDGDLGIRGPAAAVAEQKERFSAFTAVEDLRFFIAFGIFVPRSSVHCHRCVFIRRHDAEQLAFRADHPRLIDLQKERQVLT